MWWPRCAARSASGASATPARSTRWPPASCRSASGEATKLVPFLMSGDKEYEAELRLGVTTDSARRHRHGHLGNKRGACFALRRGTGASSVSSAPSSRRRRCTRRCKRRRQATLRARAPPASRSSARARAGRGPRHRRSSPARSPVVRAARPLRQGHVHSLAGGRSRRRPRRRRAPDGAAPHARRAASASTARSTLEALSAATPLLSLGRRARRPCDRAPGRRSGARRPRRKITYDRRVTGPRRRRPPRASARRPTGPWWRSPKEAGRLTLARVFC